MMFGHPWVLLFLAIPVLLCIFEALRRGLRVALPFDYGQQKAGSGLNFFVVLAAMLPALLAAVVILILAAPLQFDVPRNERKLTNIEFVLDVSGSMESNFGEGSRYDAAMQAIEYFTEQRKGDAFGLTIFGNEVLRWTPLTKDLSAIRNATPFLRPELLPRHFGGTEIGKAVKFCQTTLVERGEGDRMIILLSDGHSGDLYSGRARQIGTDLNEAEITLYAVHIGDGGAPGQLYELSSPTGGEVFAATDPGSLISVFDHIDRMKPVQIKQGGRNRIFYYGPFAIAGLVVLGLYQTSLFGLRYTPW